MRYGRYLPRWTRYEIAILVNMRLWSISDIARDYSVTRATVRRCHETYYG